MIAQPTLEAVKDRQRATWSSGDYTRIAAVTVPLGDVLCDAVDLRSGSRVLDVATGTGHVALAAARRFCDATGVDFVPALLETARARARAENLIVDFRTGDAEELPFDPARSTTCCRRSASCSPPTTRARPANWRASAGRAAPSVY